MKILQQMPDEFVDCIITSPPYWGLRDYGVRGQIGLEPTLEEYLEKMLAVTAELKRVLKPMGVMFWNHGDSYGGSNRGANDYRERNGLEMRPRTHYTRQKPCKDEKILPKCMAMQNYRLVLRMIDEQGWILRNIIIWHKPNHMPSSVRDRFTNAYEPVFMLVKSKEYWFDLDAVRLPHKWGEWYERPGGTKYTYHPLDGHKLSLGERVGHPSGKNPGDVWQIPTQPFPEAHFATFPERLVEPMVKAGCPQWICKKCGKVRERIIEKKLVVHREFNDKGKAYQNVVSGSKEMPAIPRARTGLEGHNEYYTIGWTDCGCNAGWRPGIVLDPFIGSGTVAKVATRLRRQWIGIELNPEYVEMAYRRLKGTQLEMFT